MNVFNPEPKGEYCQSPLISISPAAERIMPADIEAALARRSLIRLRFPPALEARYEAETKAARAWTIRLTLAVGLVAYNVFTLTDREILPDLIWVPFVWRLGVITPVALFAMWACGRLGAVQREAYLTLMMLGAMIGPVAFILVSRAPLAPYTMLIVVLVCMFGNITIRLRFHWAMVFTMFSLGCVGGMLVLKQDLPFILSIHLFLALIVCVSFGLLANHQLDHSDRRGFLLTLREAIRFEQLSVDKATLSKLSQIDGLTGLPNRRAFDVRLSELWQRRLADRQGFSLLMIDVDFFKRYNDFYGHPAGDGCLARVGGILRDAIVRDQDLVARYGGEEFTVLLVNAKAGDAATIAERIRLAIRDAALVHDNRDDDAKTVSVSIGVAESDAAGVTSPAELLSAADKNLYEAKRRGRDRVFQGDDRREDIEGA